VRRCNATSLGMLMVAVRHLWTTLGAMLALAFLAIPAVETTRAEGTSSAPQLTSLVELDAQLARALEMNSVPGASIAIIEDGRVRFAKGYGLADIAARIPASPVTLFRAGSIGKSFVGIAVMMLVEQQRLRLDDTLASLAPEVASSNPWEHSDPV